MAKTPSDYLTGASTDLQQRYVEWVTEQTGATFKTAAARESFALGVYLGHQLYGRFQEANREAAKPVAAKPAAARKPRAKKAVAK